jgi:mono/diheme cytochrome c family protein
MRRAALAAALAAWAGGGFGCSRALPDLERMRVQQRTDPYEASPAFPDGMGMRLPPAGTIPREARDVPAVVATGIERGAIVRDVPMPVTPELVARGRHHFAIFCAVCHSSDGSGRSVMAVNMPGNPTPSLLTSHMAEHPAGHLFEVISRGMNRMPEYDWALAPADRWAVVAYIRSLQRRLPQPEANQPDERHERR